MEVISNGESMEALLIYCYYEEDSEEIKKYYLVIRTVEGTHVASIEDFDCSSKPSQPLSEKFYKFTLKDYGTSSYLALGSRSSTDDRWCRYDICLNCETKQVRINIDSAKSETVKFRWSEPGKTINSCPSLKQQEPIYSYGDPITTNSEVKEVYISYHEPYLALYCHYDVARSVTSTDPNPTKYHSVLRSNMGLYITSISGENCQMMSNLFQLGYALVEIGDERKVKLSEMNPHKPPKRGDFSCWFYGCKTCPAKETRIFIFRDIPEDSKIWKKTAEKQDHCPKSLEKAQAVSRLESYASSKEISLVAKYKNKEGYQLDCYQEIHWSTVVSSAVIKDSEGEHVATLENLHCSSVDKLKDSFDVFDPLIFDNEDAVDLVAIGISTEIPDLHCSYIICRNCIKENTWNYYTSSSHFRGHWTLVPTETCYALTRENIITDEAAIDNLGSSTYFKLYKSFLNEADKEDDMFILNCYTEGATGKYFSQLKSLPGKHIVYIRGLDCLSDETLSKKSYMFVTRTDGKQYFILGTRFVSENKEPHPWCRYDVCLNCGKEEIKVNLKSDPKYFKIPKWSEGALKVNDPTEKECDKKEIKEENRIAIFTSTVFRESSIDCYSVKGSKKYCSVLRSEEDQLGIIARTKCIVDEFPIGRSYVYTLFTNGKYSLVKMGEEVNGEEEKGTAKESWFYYYPPRNPEDKNWKLVSNPKISLMNSVDVPLKKCLPQAKKPFELGFTQQKKPNQGTFDSGSG